MALVIWRDGVKAGQALAKKRKCMLVRRAGEIARTLKAKDGVAPIRVIAINGNQGFQNPKLVHRSG